MDTNENYIFKQIIDNVSANIYWLDRKGIFLGCNLRQLNMLGLKSINEYAGKTYEDLYEKEHIKIIKSNDQKVMNQDRVLIFEEIAVKKDGLKEYFLTTKTPLHDSNGEVIGLVGVSLNITEKKNMEDVLNKEKLAVEKHQEKIKTMKSMGANIAHELRTPLRSIMCGADSIINYFPKLLRGYELAKQANLPVENIFNRQIELLKKTPEQIFREAISANTIIDMLLMNIKEIDIEKNDLTVLSVVEVINGALNRYPFQKGQKEWVIWNKKNDFKFLGNQLLFEHIIFNLMKNSLYYVAAANKGDRRRIYINLDRGKNQNRIYFKDTGIGIAADVLPKIFDDFFSDNIHGTGIGLSFCRMAMKQMNGSIICRSEKGEFTEFILSFPIM